VLDGLTGRLVPRGDTHAFAEALVDLAHDAGKRARFGEAARDRIRTGAQSSG
jgi:glycosyltransferase involved in cell wall biosynthesis